MVGDVVQRAKTGMDPPEIREADVKCTASAWKHPCVLAGFSCVASAAVASFVTNSFTRKGGVCGCVCHFGGGLGPRVPPWVWLGLSWQRYVAVERER